MTTLTEKVKKYEHFLHNLHFAFSVELNSDKVKDLLNRASNWSYAHRQGNGELSQYEQNKLIKAAFHKLTD